MARGVKAKAVSVVQGRNNPPIAYHRASAIPASTPSPICAARPPASTIMAAITISICGTGLSSNGLDPKKDVNIIIVPVPAMVPSLINRQVDIVPMASFDQVILDQRYSGQTKTLFSYDDVLMAALQATSTTRRSCW